MRPGGRTSRGQFVPALLTLLAVVVFYVFLVKGRTAQWCMLVLLFPAIVLHARRLHDMGSSRLAAARPSGADGRGLRQSGWISPASALASIPSCRWRPSPSRAGFAVWGCIGKGQVEVNHVGAA